MARKIESLVFHADYEKIISIVEQDSKVLDLGCGTGELLFRLIRNKNVKGRGVEIDQANILKCIGKGLSVFQGNIDEGLKEYQDKSYDYVILNQTLQVTHKPQFVLKEMLRVGRKAIVSFPNFAYWKIRAQLFFHGTMPKTETLPFEWYETPNIKLVTIKDFRKFCKDNKIKILQEIFIGDNEKTLRSVCLANILSSEGLFVITDSCATD